MKERSEVLTNSSDWFWFLFSSATIGFFALPIHELGHILGYRLQGIPATMSYARESLPPGQPQTFLGVAGGPLLTQFLCCVALVLIYRNKWLLTAFPLAVIMSLDRIILYGIAWRQLLVLHRAPGMDETKMAGLLGWNPFSWYVAAAKALWFCNFHGLTPFGEMKHTIPAENFDENDRIRPALEPNRA
jgi:hypothetical protein